MGGEPVFSRIGFGTAWRRHCFLNLYNQLMAMLEFKAEVIDR
jgi:hypothetical protein